MKIHKTLVLAVANALELIFKNEFYAEKAVEILLKKNSKWGARDRRFIASNTFDIVRRFRLLDKIVIDMKLNNLNFNYHVLVWLTINDIDIPGWELFNEFDPLKAKEIFLNNNYDRKIIESIPDWIDELALIELGENKWTNELKALNNIAPIVIRVNTLKTTPIYLKNKLNQKNIELNTLITHVDNFDSILDNSFLLNKRINLNTLQEYNEGLFELQDAGSQLIAKYLRVTPNMTVIDACAGAGGKTLHIAQLMNNKGKLVAMDIESKKLNELNKRAFRAGVTIVKTTLASNSTINAYSNMADRLLLDVPCSGLGVIKRNPDTKWKLTPTFLKKTIETQEQILNHYSTMLKKGGIMVYATCSILPSENELQVFKFLENNKKFKLVNQQTIYPSFGFDGFYMAALTKEDD